VSHLVEVLSDFPDEVFYGSSVSDDEVTDFLRDESLNLLLRDGLDFTPGSPLAGQITTLCVRFGKWLERRLLSDLQSSVEFRAEHLAEDLVEALSTDAQGTSAVDRAGAPAAARGVDGAGRPTPSPTASVPCTWRRPGGRWKSGRAARVTLPRRKDCWLSRTRRRSASASAGRPASRRT
jgi:hypothetical protein